MAGFRDVLQALMVAHNIKINTCTMDNSGENNLLHSVIERSTCFNYHPYATSEKGTWKHMHQLIRRITPQGKRRNGTTSNDLVILNQFVNNDYAQTLKYLSLKRQLILEDGKMSQFSNYEN